MHKTTKKNVVVESDSESEHNSVIEDDDNRLSDDENFPISSDEENDDESDNEEDFESSKKGWAGSISKILKSEKSIVLSKAKKVVDIEKKKEKKNYTFEIDGEQKAEKSDEENPEEKVKERKKRKERHENKIKVFNLRIKPSIADLDRERTFRKIATRGVVQLFNAVKNQNANLDMKLQKVKLDSKRDEIIKSKENKIKFLDKLMSGPRARSELIDKEVKKEKMKESSEEISEDDDEEDQMTKKSTWNALRDDFMTGKKVGWDKSDDEQEEDEPMESDSD